VYLTGCHNDAVAAAARKRGDIGLMVTPLKASYIDCTDPYPVVGIDNGVFSKTTPFNPDAFRRLLREVARRPEVRRKVRFTVAPDVVGDALATLKRAKEWLPEIRDMGLPVAFAAQDGLDDLQDRIPWDQLDVLFIGGSTEWKIGQFTDERRYYRWINLFREARQRGKPVHIGRVNSAKRLEIAHYGMSCTTVDGTYLAFGPDKNLPRLLSWLDRWNQPWRLPLGRWRQENRELPDEDLRHQHLRSVMLALADGRLSPCTELVTLHRLSHSEKIV
jgi:hypothetical protein